MSIEVGAVNAGELGNAAHRNAAAAAHAGAVHHYRVQADDGLDAERLVVCAQNFIIMLGPMAMTRSTFSPPVSISFNGSVTSALRP